MANRAHSNKGGMAKGKGPKGPGAKRAGGQRAQRSAGQPARGRAGSGSGAGAGRASGQVSQPARGRAGGPGRGGAGAGAHRSPRPADAPREAVRPAGLPDDAPWCPVADACGACQHVNEPYAQQLARKDARMAALFAPVAAAGAMRPIIGMEHPYGYRNKVISPFAPGRKLADAPAGGGRGAGRDGKQRGGRKQAPRREILCGMYAAGTHRIVDTSACLVENEQAKRIIRAVRSLMPKFGLAPYDEDRHTGFLRHAVVRVGHTSGEVLVTLVTNGSEFPGSKAFCRELVKRCPGITTVVQNVNERQTNVILGQREQTLYGPGFILDGLCGLSFRISSQSFYQVNAVQTEVLYRAAVDLAAFTGTEHAIDAYCGTGTIGLVAAKSGAARVTGVDTVASAIRDARQNARHNGVANARFEVGDAGAFMRQLAAGHAGEGAGAAASAGAGASEAAAAAAEKVADAGAEARGVSSMDAPVGLAAEAGAAGTDAAAASEAPVVLLMDPPRAGASEEFLRAAAALAPQRIVYISCNPDTQVRDLAFLCEHGYTVRAVQPVDMFPHTDHVECIAALTRTEG